VQGGGLKPRAPHGGGQTASITQPARPMLFWLPTLSGIWSGSDRKKNPSKIRFFSLKLPYFMVFYLFLSALSLLKNKCKKQDLFLSGALSCQKNAENNVYFQSAKNKC
jgi:hypothetical protein